MRASGQWSVGEQCVCPGVDQLANLDVMAADDLHKLGGLQQTMEMAVEVAEMPDVLDRWLLPLPPPLPPLPPGPVPGAAPSCASSAPSAPRAGSRADSVRCSEGLREVCQKLGWAEGAEEQKLQDLWEVL